MCVQVILLAQCWFISSLPTCGKWLETEIMRVKCNQFAGNMCEHAERARLVCVVYKTHLKLLDYGLQPCDLTLRHQRMATSV